MLKITLYKNCILNETYQNVFSTGELQGTRKTVLETYLDTLTSKTYEIEYVYQENAGTLVFDFIIGTSNEIYDYNYMKVETIDEENIVKIKRYCFIQKISLKNELVYLDYIEDFWSSYSDKIEDSSICYLKNSRYIGYSFLENKPIKLPVEYEGNKQLLFETLIPDVSNARELSILVEIQYYDTSTYGTSTIRKAGIYGITLSSSQSQTARISTSSPSSISYILEEIVRLQSSGQFRTLNTDYYYQIGKIYIIPYNFIAWGVSSKFATIHEGANNEIDCWGLLDRTLDSRDYEFTITNNYKNLFVGTLNHNIKINNNGLSSKGKILYTKTYSQISIYLNYGNEMIDITKDYEYEFPINELTGEQLSLYKLSLNTKNTELDLNIEQSKITETQKIISDTEKSLKGFSRGIMKGDIGAFGGGLLNASQIGLDITYEKINREKINAEKTLNNAPFYSSNKMVSQSNFNLLNSWYGLLLFQIDSQNDDYVKMSINNVGYKTFEYIKYSYLHLNSPILYRSNHLNYTVVNFDSLNVYGSFTREIAKILNEILCSNVKIWYNHTMEEDNYV